MSEMPGSRRLTRAQVLLIVVVSALVLLFVVLLAGRLSGGSEPDPGATTAEAPVVTGTATPGTDRPTDEATEAGPAEYFASPSGNIVCALTSDSTDCVISNFTYDPVDAASCEEEGVGGHLRVEPAGATMPCEPLVVAGEVPELAYGETISAHGYTCESAESGVTCRHDESGYGFSVARATYELF